jgi:predicted dinucleotide-binding enzyme
MKIAVLGGGNFGGNLANLLVNAGHEVMVGLRDPGAARADATYRIASLQQAATHADIAIIAIPYQACADALPPLAGLLAGKIVVDATNALKDDWSPLPLQRFSSAAESLAALLPGSVIVKAFNTIFADIMKDGLLDRAGHRVTAFIAGDTDSANAIVAGIAADAGFAPLITGALGNARYLEAMAHLNIQIAVVHAGGTNAGFVYHQAA